MNRVQRVFLYTPFEHSEDRDDQVRTLAPLVEMGLALRASTTARSVA